MQQVQNFNDDIPNLKATMTSSANNPTINAVKITTHEEYDERVNMFYSQIVGLLRTMFEIRRYVADLENKVKDLEINQIANDPDYQG